MVDGRYWDTNSRQERLLDGWGFVCSCSLCEDGKEEETRTKIRTLQDSMREECDHELDSIPWTRLCSLQGEVVSMVRTLVCAPILLLRELQSWIHLAQLARKEEEVEAVMVEYRDLVEKVKIGKAAR